MVGSSPNRREFVSFQFKTSFSISSREGTERLMHIPRILVGDNLEVGVTSLMKRTLGACN